MKTRNTFAMGTIDNPSILQRMRNWKKTYVLILIALVIYGFTFVLTQGEPSLNHFFSIMKIASYLGIIAAGQMLALLIGGIDLSVSSMVTLTSILASTFLSKGIPLGYTVILVLMIGSFLGFISGLLVAYVRIQPIVATLAMSSIIKGLYLLISGGATQTGISQMLRDFANKNLGSGLTGSVLLWLVISVAVICMMKYTVFGRNIYIMGSNEMVAHLSGINTSRIKVGVFTISALMNSIAGIMVLGFTGTTSLKAGDSYMMPSVAACLLGGVSPLGGRGEYFDVIIGVFALKAIENLLTALKMTSAERITIEGIILLVFMIIYNGTFKKRKRLTLKPEKI